MKEVWRNVVGYEGYYEVSNFGRVKSLERVDRRGKRVPERILKPAKSSNGYLTVALNKDGIQKTFSVHRLVGMAFPDLVDWIEEVKGKPFEELTINHLNEVKTDNRVENLQWCPLEYNLKYGTHYERVAKTKTGVYNTKKSKPVYQSTLSDEFVREWPSASEVERQTGWSQSNISQCCLGKKKSAYRFRWSYIHL